MINAHRILVLTNMADGKRWTMHQLADRIKGLENQLPFSVEPTQVVQPDDYLQTLLLLAGDPDITESLAELGRNGVKIKVQSGSFAQAPIEINERGELVIATGVALRTIRSFLGLDDLRD